MWTVTSSTTAAPPTTALHATVVTDAPVSRVVGPHNDSSDFYGIALGLVAIVVAIALTRLVFRGRGGAGRAGGKR
jgi:hypothetical protein